MSHYKKHIFICTNQKDPGKKCCADSGGEPFVEQLKKRLQELGLHGPGQFRVSRSGCLGRCKLGPSLVIYPDGVWYTYSTFDDIEEIIHRHLIEGKRVEHLLMKEPE